MKMGFKGKFMKVFIQRFGKPRIEKLYAKQSSINEMPGVLHPTPNSPTRFDIPLEAMKLLQERDDIEIQHMFPIRRLLSCIKNIHLSVDSIPENPSDPKSEATMEFLNQLREYAQSLGVHRIEFTKLNHDLIFNEHGVLYDNAIVLTMEMSKEQIDKAPSQDTLNMVFGTYDDLGKAANKITDFLRAHGFAAHADHPLGGLVLFPPLAQQAGIGWVGKNGVLITPEYGPRLRLAAVYTNIANLPFSESNPHGWIDEYCKTCGLCIRQCPSKAILERSITNDKGQITNIKQRECFEYFAQYYGCSVCIKVCPFSEAGDIYERLKAVVEKKH